MKNLELRKEIAKILPDYKFSLLFDSIFAVKELEEKRFKTSNTKNHFITTNRIIFISDEMYPGTDKNFRYAINYTKCKMRMYRCRTWFEHEYNKVYISGKTDEELIKKIQEQFS